MHSVWTSVEFQIKEDYSNWKWLSQIHLGRMHHQNLYRFELCYFEPHWNLSNVRSSQAWEGMNILSVPAMMEQSAMIVQIEECELTWTLLKSSNSIAIVDCSMRNDQFPGSTVPQLSFAALSPVAFILKMSFNYLIWKCIIDASYLSVPMNFYIILVGSLVYYHSNCIRSWTCFSVEFSCKLVGSGIKQPMFVWHQ